VAAQRHAGLGDAVPTEQEEDVALGVEDRILPAVEMPEGRRRRVDRPPCPNAHRGRATRRWIDVEFVDPQVTPSGQHGLASHEDQAPQVPAVLASRGDDRQRVGRHVHTSPTDRA